MTKYCVTAVNRANKNDDRVSELKVWEYKFYKEKNEWLWDCLGKKSANFVVGLLAENHEVLSAKEIKEGDKLKIKAGHKIEFVLRIADNNDKVKITDMPSF